MKKTFLLLSVVSFAAMTFTSCDMIEKYVSPKKIAINPFPKDKNDYEVINKAEDFARRYSYAVLQENWVKAENIENEMIKYRKTLTFSDQNVFDNALNNY